MTDFMAYPIDETGFRLHLNKFISVGNSVETATLQRWCIIYQHSAYYVVAIAIQVYNPLNYNVMQTSRFILRFGSFIQHSHTINGELIS